MLDRMVSCQPLCCAWTPGPWHCSVQVTSHGVPSGGYYTWRGVCECVQACGGGARPNCLGRWSTAWRRQGGPPEDTPASCSGWPQFLACRPVTGFGLILIFVLPGTAPLPGLFSCSARLSGDCFQVSFTQRMCSLHLGVSSPFLSPPPSHFPANRLVSVWTVAFSSPGMISSWLKGLRFSLASVGHVVSVKRDHSTTPERRRRVTVAEKG